MIHAATWFEIPSADFDRACTFYEKALDITLHKMDMGGPTIGIFAGDPEGVGGHINPPCEDNAPSSHGSIIYLNAEGKLDATLARIAELGNTIVLPKTDLGGPGFIALFIDSEGNKVGLHAMNP